MNRVTLRTTARAATVLVVVLVATGVLTVGAAQAAPSLAVSPTSDLPAEDATTVQARGSGYDTSKGIYVAYCVVPPAGQTPSPCGGGADTSGASGGSVWISDDPPPYGDDLAEPYGPGGSFDVSVTVTPTIGDVDCRTTACAVVTRNDHTRSSDRGQDVIVPVSFARPAPEPAPDPQPEPDPEPSPSAEPRSTATSQEPGGSADGAAAVPDAAAQTPDDTPTDGRASEPEPAGSDEPAVEPAADAADEENGADQEGDPADAADERDEVTSVAASSDVTGAGTGAGIIAGIVVFSGVAGGLAWQRRRRSVP